MTAKFNDLRMAVRMCREQRGASRGEEALEFRRAATVGAVADLLSAYDEAIAKLEARAMMDQNEAVFLEGDRGTKTLDTPESLKA